MLAMLSGPMSARARFWFSQSAAPLRSHKVIRGNLANHTAVVTGAKSGIGKAIAPTLPGFHKGTDPEGIILPRLLVSPAKFLST